MKKETESEIKQKEHYNKLAEVYEKHYDDKYSRMYRKEFIENPLFKDIQLKDKLILEAMCGSGQTTKYLLNHKSKIVGLDISEHFIKRYKKRWPSCEVKCKSILDTGFKDNTFDLVVVVGGLHHLHPYSQKSIFEIHRILKPQGYFCFMEPHNQSIMDYLRKLWYKFDSLFESNEAAINLPKMKKENKSRFFFLKEEYLGNIGYYFILSSMIWRIPIKLKKYYSNFLMLIERLAKPLMTRWTAGYVVCQWQKK